MCDLLDQTGTADTRAAYYVRVPVQVLRATVQRNIEAPLGGSEVDRARERVVDERDQPVFFRERGGCFEVAHLQRRVRHCFDIDRFCVRSQLAFPGIGIVTVDEIELEPEASEVLCKKVMSAAVQTVLGQQ